jgi:DNA polymerase-3 subunit gamma/tau
VRSEAPPALRPPRQAPEARPAAAAPPAPEAWPATAPLGSGRPAARPDPRPARPATPAAPAAGGLDAAALRQSWDEVLAAVKARKRTAHAQLADATVSGVEGNRLVLAFQHAPILRQFQASTGPDVLQEALTATLGTAFELSCVLHGHLPAHAASAPTAASAPAPQPTPSYDDFAPGDEAVPEDPDAPPPPEEVRGEDAALRLVQSQLGGRVVSTSGGE